MKQVGMPKNVSRELLWNFSTQNEFVVTRFTNVCVWWRCCDISTECLRVDLMQCCQMYGFFELWKKVRILGKIQSFLVIYGFLNLDFLEKWIFRTDFFIYLDYSLNAYLYLLPKWSWGSKNLPFLKYCNALEWENSL